MHHFYAADAARRPSVYVMLSTVRIYAIHKTQIMSAQHIIFQQQKEHTNDYNVLIWFDRSPVWLLISMYIWFLVSGYFYVDVFFFLFFCSLIGFMLSFFSALAYYCFAWICMNFVLFFFVFYREVCSELVKGRFDAMQSDGMAPHKLYTQ